MRIAALWLFTVLLNACTAFPPTSNAACDAPEYRYAPTRQVALPASYAQALEDWRSPDDVNAWIGAAFSYDLARAVALSESQRDSKPSLPIFAPARFYEHPAGVCVDLARFAVETVQRIAPGLKARYLMIEFEPVTIQGQVLRRHWMAVYEAADGIHVFADSKRPGFIAGPYPSVADFIAEYAAFRGREVVSFRELQHYQRKSKARAGDIARPAS